MDCDQSLKKSLTMGCPHLAPATWDPREGLWETSPAYTEYPQNPKVAPWWLRAWRGLSLQGYMVRVKSLKQNEPISPVVAFKAWTQLLPYHAPAFSSLEESFQPQEVLLQLTNPDSSRTGQLWGSRVQSHEKWVSTDSACPRKSRAPPVIQAKSVWLQGSIPSSPAHVSVLWAFGTCLSHLLPPPWALGCQPAGPHTASAGMVNRA